MSLAPLDPAQAAAALAQRRLELAARLAVGQLVRVQVLSREEGRRYLVRMLGEAVLVESRSELSPGEELEARVTSLDERIELERVARSPVAQAGDTLHDAVVISGLGTSRSAELIEELFRRYRASLRGADAETLERHVARAARPQSMALAGLVLRKAGLPVDPALLEPLCEALDRRGAPPAAGPGSARSVAERILNTPGGGSVSHQVCFVPIEAGGRSFEAQLAFFEEQQKGAAQGLRHRKAVLVLDLERLGRVEARAVTAEDHVRVVIAAESSEATNALLRHAEALARALAEAAWKVDEIRHETRAPAASSAVVDAAVDHLITPGSVSRLV